MPKRIAITIAGAVSLGSYEAGVLYEALEAIRRNNELASSEDQKIYIDVLTGASAGGMTAAMVAQCLMYDADALKGETSNILYQTWVEDISLMRLARMKWNEPKWNSLFSSNLIESIGASKLIRSMLKPGSGPHSAVEQVRGALEPLRLGLALTNLNGIDYMIPIVGNDDGGFNYTTSLDQKLFEVGPDRDLIELRDDGSSCPATWERLCEAAVGSGAFPAAFRPKAIDHAVEEFGVRLPADEALRQQGKTYVDWIFHKSPASFAHSDGGILQNQPLGIAKNLVDMAVAKREKASPKEAYGDSANRLYIFVTPHAVKSSSEHLTASKITIWGELKHLLRVYTRQATFHDWITAEALNQKVRVLDERAGQLGDKIAEGHIDIQSLGKASGDLNAMLMADREQEHINRLREQYSKEYDRVVASAGQDAGKVFLSAIATLEAAAHLEDRDKMKIVAVIADAQRELAGAGLSAFVGFFEKSYRKHDYWMGRVKARAYLQRADVKKILGVVSWPDEVAWKTPFPNPTNVTLPLRTFQLFRSAWVPLAIMIAIRPAILVFLLLCFSIVGYLFWGVLHR